MTLPLFVRRALCLVGAAVHIPISIFAVIALIITSIFEYFFSKYDFSSVIYGLWLYFGMLLGAMWARRISCDKNGISIFGLFSPTIVEWGALTNVLKKHEPPFWDLILIEGERRQILIHASEIKEELRGALRDNGFDLNEIDYTA